MYVRGNIRARVLTLLQMGGARHTRVVCALAADAARSRRLRSCRLSLAAACDRRRRGTSARVDVVIEVVIVVNVLPSMVTVVRRVATEQMHV